MHCSSLFRVLVLLLLTLFPITASASTQKPLHPIEAKAQFLDIETELSTRMAEHNKTMLFHLSGMKSAVISMMESLGYDSVDLTYIDDLIAADANHLVDAEQIVGIMFEKLQNDTTRTTTKKNNKKKMMPSFETSMQVAKKHLDAMSKEIGSFDAFNKAMARKLAFLKQQLHEMDHQQTEPSFENDKAALLSVFQAYLASIRDTLIPSPLDPNAPFHAQANTTASLRHNNTFYDCDLNLSVLFPNQKENVVMLEGMSCSCEKNITASELHLMGKKEREFVYGLDRSVVINSWWVEVM